MRVVFCAVLLLFSFQVSANDYTYEKIASRYSQVAMSQKDVLNFKMQGECLVGLKELNFKKNKTFDPIAEWTNYRSKSLLEQFPPCEVLIIMQLAKKKLTDAGTN